VGEYWLKWDSASQGTESEKRYWGAAVFGTRIGGSRNSKRDEELSLRLSGGKRCLKEVSSFFAGRAYTGSS